MKKKSPVLPVIIFLVLAIIGSILFYTFYYLPNARMSSQYVEFYQEYIADQYASISIDAINHDVIIKASEDDLIHISFFQPIDNSNLCQDDGRNITINIIEEAPSAEGLFPGSYARYRTISIYLPTSIYYSFSNKTVSGNLSIEGVNIRKLEAESVSGAIEIASSRMENTSVVTNSGLVSCSGCNYDVISIESVTGDITLQAALSKENYNLDLISRYGALMINSQRVMAQSGEDSIVINSYSQQIDSSMKIKLSSLRGQIALDFPVN